MQPYARTKLHEIRDRKHRARAAQVAARRAVELAGDDQHARQVAEVALVSAQGDESLAAELESTMLTQLGGYSADVGSGFLDDANVQRELAQLADSSAAMGSVNLGPLSSAETLAAAIESGSWGSRSLAAVNDVDLPDSARQTAPLGVRQALARPLSLLDLIPTTTMEGRSFSYAPEAVPSGAPTAAVETVEGASKAQTEIDLGDAEVVAKTIAHYVKVKRQHLADLPGLETLINNRLVYGVLRRVEDQIVGGDGTGETLLGILHTAGIGAPSGVSGDNSGDAILRAITAVINANAVPNGVVLNPTDLANLLIKKAVTSGEYLASDGPFGANVNTIWGRPCLASTVVPAGTALVGDFSQCTLFVRESVNVRLSDSDQDDFSKNRCTALGEGRFGLAIWAPAGFATATI